MKFQDHRAISRQNTIAVILVVLAVGSSMLLIFVSITEYNREDFVCVFVRTINTILRRHHSEPTFLSGNENSCARNALYRFHYSAIALIRHRDGSHSSKVASAHVVFTLANAQAPQLPCFG
jgi:hypothetical protein